MSSSLTPDMVLKDPEFFALPREERRKVLSKIDPEYVALPEAEQWRVVDRTIPAWHSEGPPTISTDPTNPEAAAEDFMQGSPTTRFAYGVGSGLAGGAGTSRSQLREKSVSAFADGSLTKAVGYELGADIPFIGPGAVEAGEHFASGDIAGGAGRTVGTVLGALGIEKGIEWLGEKMGKRIPMPKTKLEWDALLATPLAEAFSTGSQVVHAESAGKLARALQPGTEERKFIQKIQPAMIDVSVESRMNGRPLKDGASLEAAASAAVRTLDDKIQAFIEPFSNHPASFNIDGNKIADAVGANVPSAMLIEKPNTVNNIAKQVEGYRRPLGFKEAKQILAEKNAALKAFHSMSPADQYRADMQRKFLVDTAVADTIRSELYPRVAELAGPGMDQLMKRQGAAITLRDLAHGLADDQAIEGGLRSRIVANAPTSATKVGVLKAGVRKVLGESPNQLISAAFKPDEIAKAAPYYPTPKLRVPGPQRQLRAGYEMPQAEGYTSTTPPPYVDPHTRAFRKGLLLTERAGGSYELGPPETQFTTEPNLEPGGIVKPKYTPPAKAAPMYELISEDASSYVVRDPATGTLHRILKTNAPPPQP